MVGTFEIGQGANCTGQVHVERQGLYYRISCRCELPVEGMYRLLVTCDGKQEDLGILVPLAGAFGMEKRIPVKRLGTGEPEFRLISRNEISPEKFIPVYPEEPFSYMSRLKDAYLEARNGQLGICIRE